MLLTRAMLAFIALPGVVAFMLPVLIGELDGIRIPGSIFGLIFLLLGSLALLWCIRDFYVSGKGTLAPWDPPEHLVNVGLYNYSRNPMYVAVLVTLLGWVILFGSPVLLIYTIGVAVAFRQRVIRSEEPWLAQNFGQEWLAYKESVPRWLMR
jgi:protein-S-isoprenylcysteine O-methyltransferase Ste14